MNYIFLSNTLVKLFLGFWTIHIRYGMCLWWEFWKTTDIIWKIDPKHKWYLSKKDYPKDTLPPYFPGGAYIVSTVIAKKLASNFHLVKWIPIDDVYIGLVAHTLDITLTHSKLFGMGDCKHYKIHLACREFTRPDEVLAAWKTLTMFNL